jgi:type II secretory pathway component PulF
MTAISDPISAFAYRAQTSAGDAISGTIDATNVDDANRRLAGLQLRVLQLDLAKPPPKPRPLTGEDFLAFNTQLAHLTTAGLPVEQGLRLIAEDMRSRRMAETVREIAGELESGRALPEVFERYADNFPPLYGRLINAGVRAGNLPAMLLNLGRHLELIARLRAMLWRAFAYPIMVLVSLGIVLTLLCAFVFPKFELIFKDFRTDLPMITQVVLGFSKIVELNLTVIAIAAAVIIFGFPLLWQLFRRLKWDQAILETLVFPLPLVGPSLRRNLLARWCDALKIAVEAGLDLPAAVTLAADAVGSPKLRHDAQVLVDAVQAGRPLDDRVRLRLVPPSIVTVLALASANDDLPSGLATLGQMFQQQAEIKMALIPAVLTPLLIVLIAFVIAFVVLAMFAPMIALIQAISGPVGKH